MSLPNPSAFQFFETKKKQQSVTQTGCWLKMADFKKATRIPDFLQHSTNIPVS